MKKNVIAMLLAVVMASGSIGTVPVMAAETTAQESGQENEQAQDDVYVQEVEETVEETEDTEEQEAPGEAVTTEELSSKDEPVTEKEYVEDDAPSFDNNSDEYIAESYSKEVGSKQETTDSGEDNETLFVEGTNYTNRKGVANEETNDDEIPEETLVFDWDVCYFPVLECEYPAGDDISFVADGENENGLELYNTVGDHASFDTDHTECYVRPYCPGKWSIKAIDNTTGKILKITNIEIKPEERDYTTCIGNSFAETFISVNVPVNATTSDGIVMRAGTPSMESHTWTETGLMYDWYNCSYLIKGVELGDYTVFYYAEGFEDYPILISHYHVVDHNYEESSVIKEALCTEAGLIEKKCSICGDVVQEVIPATGHVWNKEYTVDKEATCTEEGSESIHCSVCDVTDESTITVIPKKDHTYGEWIVKKEATCTEEGSREKVCADCGDTITETIPATGHSYGEWTVTKEATETETGLREKVCTVCGDKVEEVIPAPEETVSITIGSRHEELYFSHDEQIEIEFEIDEELDIEYRTYDIPDGFSTYNAVCAILPCGAGTGTVKVINKNDGTILKIFNIIIEPFSYNGGIDEWYICKGHEIDTSLYAMPFSGYKYTEYEGLRIKHYITEEGSSEYWPDPEGIDGYGTYTVRYALIGDEIGDYLVSYYNKSEDHPAYRALYHVVDHDYQESSILKEATCTEDGLVEKKCSNCGDTITETIPATGHVWNQDYTIDKEATCTEEGSESIHCSVCNVTDESTVTVIPKTDHTYGEWTITKEATCTEEGSQEKACTVCGDTVTEAIPIIPHVWNTEYTVDKEATCTEEGSESIHCTVCGEIQKGSSRAIEKKDHTYSDWNVTKEATCTEEGEREKICLVCEDKVTEIISATGHRWNSYYTIDEAPTITREGSKSIHCSVCDEINPDSVQSIPRLAGTWKKDSKGWWYSWSDGSYSKSKFENISGKTYYFNNSGYMVTGWQSIGGKWYYFDASGVMKTGWQSIGGTWYYFDEDGEMAANEWVGNYYLGASGAMAKGWQNIDGSWYYFNNSGVKQTSWQRIGNVWYYFNGDGVMQTGLQKIGGATYFFNESGAMATGWQSTDGKWYYFEGSGAAVKGWKQISGKWYYFNDDKVMQTGLQKLDGATYFFNGSGAMATGWQKIDNKWYYFEGSGAMAVNKWVGDYYLGEDGVMATNTWISGYYVGADGKWIPNYKAAG